MKTTFLAVGFVSFVLSGQVNAALDGKTVSMNRYYPDLNTLHMSYGTAVVGAGVEFPNWGTTLDVNISDSQITFTGVRIAVDYSGSFNGAVFGTVNNDFVFTSLSLDSANSNIPFDVSRFWFDTQHVYVDLASLPITTSTKVTLNVGIAPVPEPSTYLAGISALGMLGLFGWRNRK